MGNCTAGLKKRKGESAPDGEKSTANKPGEDVTYASIDHSSVRRAGRARASTDDECDYATVQVPAALQPESEASSKDEREDDYVLMG